MRLPYFWMHTEARNDAKLRSLTAEQHRVWFRLLCYAAEQDARGTIAVASWSVVAVEAADGDEALLDSTCQRLEALRIIGPDWRPEAEARAIAFLAFDRRNERKPSDRPEATAERKRQERERAKARKAEEASDEDESRESHTVSRDVTPSSRLCHAVSRDVTDREEERREEKKENTPPPTPQGVARGAVKPQILTDPEAEPFDPGGVAVPIALPDDCPNTQEQVREAEDRVAAIFGADQNDPAIARSLCVEFKAAWVVEAFEMARDDGVGKRGKWVRSVLDRFKAAKQSDRERAASRASTRAAPDTVPMRRGLQPGDPGYQEAIDRNIAELRARREARERKDRERQMNPFGTKTSA